MLECPEQAHCFVVVCCEHMQACMAHDAAHCPASTGTTQHATPSRHLPVLQAGNQSLLTYRSDIGIPGYTGFTPSHLGVPVPVKGCKRLGES
jgi:hypothetical protein